MHLLHTLLGLLLLAAGMQVGRGMVGTSFLYGGAFTVSSPGALNVFLVHAVLIVPGAVLLGHGLAPWLGRRLRSAIGRLGGLAGGAGWRWTVGLVVLGTLAAGLGHLAILGGHPLTDDEVVARFGGQILARGQLGVSLLAPQALAPGRFLLTLPDGTVTSFDWLGIQLTWALAELTRLDHWVFALAVGFTLAALAASGRRLLGPGWGAAAVLLALSSPMVVAISLLTHAHTVSRLFVALAVLAWLKTLERPRSLWPVALGLATGAGVLTRPAESLLLLLPLLLALAVDAGRGREGARPALLRVVLGGLGPLALLLVYNTLVGGTPLFTGRMSDQGSGDGHSLLGAAVENPVLHRFGVNLGHNLMMLLVWFAGALGTALVVLGLTVDRTTKLLAAGVGLLLLLGLFHDSIGIHMVGPIHYAECAVPLAVLALAGARRALEWARTHDLDAGRLGATLAVGLLVSGLWFNAHSLANLRRQGEIHTTIHGFVADALAKRGVERAVVFAPRYQELWRSIPHFLKVGTWVYDWPHPHPDGRDAIVFLHRPRTHGELAEVRRSRPDRQLFVLSALPQAPWLKLVPLEEAVTP